MWDPGNKDMCERFGAGGAVPSDTDYGTYISRELVALGYMPKQLYLAGQAAFVASVPVLGGAGSVLLICKAGRRKLDAAAARTLVSLRSMQRATRYVMVTEGMMDTAAAQMAAANGVAVADGFRVGGDVTAILNLAGMAPARLVKALTDAAKRADSLARQLRETQEALAEQERQVVVASVAGGVVKKPPERMDPMEKYEAGLMDPQVPYAIRAVAGTNAVTAATLAKRMKCSAQKAETLLAEMAQLGVVTPGAPGTPRFVKASKPVLDQRFKLGQLPPPEFLD